MAIVVGVDLAGGDVVEEEERLGAHADQVVDAHGDQVDADRVVATGRPGHHQLRADPVGRGHQHRAARSAPCRAGTGRRTRRCPPPWRAAARRRHRRRRCRRRRRRRWRRLGPRRQTPGSAAWSAGRHRSGRPSVTGVDDGTGPGRVVAGEAGVAEPGVDADGRLQVLDADVGQRVGAEDLAAISSTLWSVASSSSCDGVSIP